MLSAAVVLPSSIARAQWQANGTLVSGAADVQDLPDAISDGAGGAFVTWRDHRSGNYDVYLQRISSTGVPLWTPHGAPICTLAGDQSPGGLVSDNAGGAIIVWTDTRSGNQDIYAQRVSSSGTALWTANGVVISADPAADSGIGAVADGSGGAIILFNAIRGASANDLYAQRINASGVVQWAANGVVVCNVAGDQLQGWPVSDGAGGAIAGWWDYRSGNIDVYVQRLNSSGSPQWAANGVGLCTLSGDQAIFGTIPDGGGGAIEMWSDSRAGNPDLYVQRVNASGAPQWTANGAPMCTNASIQSSPALITDGAGGGILAWYDNRIGNYDIFMQRFNAAGVPLWAVDGTRITFDPGSQNNAHPAPDGAGGAIMVWYDLRSGSTELYEQHVTATGASMWATSGVPLITNTMQPFSNTIISDGKGGAIVAFQGSPFGSSDIFAQRIEGAYGYWGYPEPVVTTVKDVPKDNGGRVAVNWTASQRDIAVPATIGYYSIWRAADVAPFGASSASNLIALRDVRADTKPGARTAASGYYWELVGTQTAYRFKTYSYSTSTRADSVLGNQATEYFMVAAHDVNDSHIAFASNAISGHSVDNLAPLAPLALIAQRIGNYVHLRWNRVRVPDIRDYSVYRKTSSGVTPIPINFLASANDTVLTDTSPPASAIYYIVTAYDVHNNQSAPSNEAAVAPSTAVGNLPPITGLMVLQNRPNPFANSSSFDMGLPASSKVEVEVFDVGGHRVADQRLGTNFAGWHTVVLDARDDAGHPLASGVYFYRVHAAGQTQTRKLIITR
jgi:hypothetical protein